MGGSGVLVRVVHTHILVRRACALWMRADSVALGRCQSSKALSSPPVCATSCAVAVRALFASAKARR